MAKHYNNERAGHADNDSLNGLWGICSMTYLKVELPRDLPRTDCFRRASACFRAHSPGQISPAETIHISRPTHNERSKEKTTDLDVAS